MRKQIPILFSTPMVQAIQRGNKTVTRRVVKPQFQHMGADTWLHPSHTPEEWVDGMEPSISSSLSYNYVECDGGERFGKWKIGDVLWVRESAKIIGISGTPVVRREGENPVGFQSIREIAIEYAADGVQKTVAFPSRLKTNLKLRNKLANGVFLEAARIWLEVVGVRVERLQDITEEQAKAEGVQCHTSEIDQTVRYRDYVADASGYGASECDYPTVGLARTSFQTLWQKINGAESWDANPWVWVVEFKVLSTTGKPDNL